MQQRDFGNTGLTVSALGLGAGQVGGASLDESAAATLLNAALDGGVTLIDTARGYGLSEERIGRHLAHRRAEFVLSTKVGYGITGHADWAGGCIAAGIDEALARLRTDVIDIVHLHSCPLDTLRAGEVIDALLRARAQGKLRIAAYSGENDELAWAVQSGYFGSVECSVNLFDQGSLQTVLPRATAAGPWASLPSGRLATPRGGTRIVPSAIIVRRIGSECRCWTSKRLVCRGTPSHCDSVRMRPEFAAPLRAPVRPRICVTMSRSSKPAHCRRIR